MSEVEGWAGIKWAIGNALSVVADDRVFEQLAAIAEDKRHGHDREMVALALGNMKDPRAVDVLVRLLDDDQVAGHAIMALGKLRARGVRSKIEPFLDHPKTWVRREARKALKRMVERR
jgi:HEAT repeat protein